MWTNSLVQSGVATNRTIGEPMHSYKLVLQHLEQSVDQCTYTSWCCNTYNSLWTNALIQAGAATPRIVCGPMHSYSWCCKTRNSLRTNALVRAGVATPRTVCGPMHSYKVVLQHLEKSVEQCTRTSWCCTT